MTLWLILIAVPMLFGLYAQFRVSSAYNKNILIPSRGRITGREAAQAVLASAGIHDVEIVRVEGQLTDHFNPSERRLALSGTTMMEPAWPRSASPPTRLAMPSSRRLDTA